MICMANVYQKGYQSDLVHDSRLIDTHNLAPEIVPEIGVLRPFSDGEALLFVIVEYLREAQLHLDDKVRELCGGPNKILSSTADAGGSHGGR